MTSPLTRAPRMLRWAASAALALASSGCASSDTEGGGGSADAAPASGRFPGSYSVPVSPELEAAATYPVDEIEWRVHDGTITLDYDLPRGLVGRALRVRFTGDYVAGAETATLTGNVGTAECTIAAERIECLETMRGLLPIEVDYDVVEEIALEEYDGPVEDRLAVAEQFSGDPIGIAHLDVGAGAAEDGD